MKLEPLASYSFPTDESGLAVLDPGVDELAGRCGAAVREWIEDGLGPARGFAVRLPSGRVVVLVRYRNLPGSGTHALVDAAELGTLGAAVLVGELIGALSLDRAMISHVAGPEHEASARAMMRRVAEIGIRPGPPIPDEAAGLWPSLDRGWQTSQLDAAGIKEIPRPGRTIG